jgi:hypothetical protein
VNIVNDLYQFGLASSLHLWVWYLTEILLVAIEAAPEYFSFPSFSVYVYECQWSAHYCNQVKSVKMPVTNTLAYWTNWNCTKKMMCGEYSQWSLPIWSRQSSLLWENKLMKLGSGVSSLSNNRGCARVFLLPFILSRCIWMSMECALL